jgi:SAM-dependent methyltransferase
MVQAADYVHGTSRGEQERLRNQPKLFEHEARSLLDRLGIQSGWRAIDVGCGPLGILDLLSERVGTEGSVVGLEYDAGMAAVARTLSADQGLANVQIVQADARHSGLPRRSFDLAHERLVLINVPNPEQIVSEMVALVRPGGVVALQDVDRCSWLCEPPHPAWTTLLTMLNTIWAQDGADPFIGRRLPGLLRGAGLVDVGVDVQVQVHHPGHNYRALLLTFIDNVSEKLTARGLLTQGEITELSESLREHLDDQATTVIFALLVQAWGRKPY